MRSLARMTRAKSLRLGLSEGIAAYLYGDGEGVYNVIAGALPPAD